MMPLLQVELFFQLFHMEVTFVSLNSSNFKQYIKLTYVKSVINEVDYTDSFEYRQSIREAIVENCILKDVFS